ncbi:MAG: Unknown protein [uncultured Aureispira sp.]|uniref:Uncharacterized protein n=1 Tax=uncultured Aureispira sp. TaxID=1331704 RepID=A0A6S6UAR4_9BACT|nr:MAG: Unknown protein [uncultured Aureispira sp.]
MQSTSLAKKIILGYEILKKIITRLKSIRFSRIQLQTNKRGKKKEAIFSDRLLSYVGHLKKEPKELTL